MLRNCKKSISLFILFTFLMCNVLIPGNYAFMNAYAEVVPASSQNESEIGTTEEILLEEDPATVEEGTATEGEPATVEEGTVTEGEPATVEEGTVTEGEPATVEEGTVTEGEPATVEEGTVTEGEPATVEEGTVTEGEPATAEEGTVTEGDPATVEEGTVTEGDPATAEEGTVTEGDPATVEEGTVTEGEPATAEEGTVTEGDPATAEEGTVTEGEPATAEEGTVTEGDPVTVEEGTTTEETTQAVTINVKPEDATVVVKDGDDAVVTAESDGSYKLAAGEYAYTASKEGYKDATGTITVAGADVTVDVVLENAEIAPETHLVNIALTPEDATVVVKDGDDAVVTAESDGSYKLAAGEYAYTASKEGYKDATGTITVADSDVTVDVVLENAEIVQENHVTLSIDKLTIDGGYVLEPTLVGFTDGESAWDVLKREMESRNIEYQASVSEEYKSAYIESIAGDGEFDHGPSSGWMYNVNDWYPNVGVSLYSLKDGDVVEVRYTTDLGADLGADFNGTDKRLKDLVVDSGILSPSFEPDTMKYTLAVSPDATEVVVTPIAANKNLKLVIESNGNNYRRTDKIAVQDNQVITVTCGGNTYTVTVVFSGGDQDFADAVIELINAIPELESITIAEKDQITKVEEAYNNLSAEQKPLVTNYETLTKAVAKIAQIEQENKIKADEVIALIKAIPAVGEISTDNQGQVAAARTAFDALSKEQKALVSNLTVLEAAEERIAILLNPGGIAKNYRDDFLLSTLDLDVNVGENQPIVVLDTPRVGQDDGAYNRQDLALDIINLSSEDDVIKIIRENVDGTKKGERIYVEGLKEGQALIKISYPSYEGQDGVIAVNVVNTANPGPSLEIEKDITKYDIVYFTGDSGDYTFDISTDSDATAFAKVNGKRYDAQSGSISVSLADGYNPIVVTATNEIGTTSKTYNVRAKKMAYKLENLTREGSSEFYEGDTIKICFTGMVTPVPKVSRIYNPSEVRVTYQCSLPRYSAISGAATQYGISADNGMEFELTGAGTCKMTDGHIDENWFGSGLFSEAPVGTAPPNTNADQTDHRFSILPEISFEVLENPDYNPQLFAAEVANELEIWPGDMVKVSIPNLDTKTIENRHQPDQEWIVDLIDSYTVFLTDIPGLESVQSEHALELSELDNLKTVTFRVPDNTKPGTYSLKGAYVWLKYGPTWWTKVKHYYDGEISDVVIEVKEATPGEQHDAVEIANETLKNKLAMAAGKPDGYAKKLTIWDLDGLTGDVDISNAGVTDADMPVMLYLKNATSINLSNNPGITSASVNMSSFDWTTPKSLDFSGCTGVTEIAESAFDGCINLTSIKLPDVTSVGNFAFADCNSLTGITIPDSVTSLGEGSLSGCSSLTEVKLSENITAISDNLFEDCGSLRSIIVPDKVETIGEWCFAGCNKLKTITMPDTLKSVGMVAFKDCKRIEYFKVPKNLETLGKVAFYGAHVNIFDMTGTKFTELDEMWKLNPDAVVLTGSDAGFSTTDGTVSLGAETLTITHAIPEDKTIIWSSANADVAMVDNGVVSGVAPGQTVVYAKTEDGSYSGICRIMVTDNGKARLKEITLTDMELNETLDAVKYVYSAGIAANVRTTTVTAVAADEGSTIKVNGVSVTEGTPSQAISLKVGENIINIEVASADGTTIKIYKVKVNMAAVTIGEDHVILGNDLLQEKLLKLLGKESGYIGKLTFEELASIQGVIDLSDSQITDDDMEMMKYLKGVTGFDFTNNTGITQKTVKPEYFDWKIPKSLNFTGCTGIDDMQHPFEERANLTEIYLPETVTVLRGSAFRCCHDLTYVSAPGATKVQDSAFCACESLEEVVLSENLEEIGYYSFGGAGIKEFIIPEGMVKLDSYVFSGCKELRYVYLPSTISSNPTDLGNSLFKNCEKAIIDLRKTPFTSLPAVGTYYDWKVPSTATVLYPGIDSDLPEKVSINLGEGTLKISSSIPQDQTVIWGSSRPDIVRVDSGVLTGVSCGEAVVYAKTADNRYSGICNVSVTGTDNARLSELSLSDITLDERFNPAVVFYDAKTGSHIKDTVVTAKSADGNSTIKVNGLVVADGAASEPIKLAYGINKITVQVTPKDGSVTKTYTVTINKKNIYEGDDYVAIASLSLKNKLLKATGKEIGYAGNLTFEELAGIEGDLDLSNTAITDEEMVVMKYLTGVSSINLSGNKYITNRFINKDAFDWTVPKSLDFSGCTGITEIARESFEECTGLTGIGLPESVTSIGYKAFRNCTSLESITLPGSLEKIDACVFEGCTSLTEADLSRLSADVKIGYQMFYGCTGITDLTKFKFSSEMTTLPRQMFGECTGITSIDLPETITSMDNSVFYGCSGLVEVELPYITTLGENTFSSCHNLKKVTFSDEVTRIPDNFFNNCTGLTEYVIPENVTSLGYGAFDSCSNLKEIDFSGIKEFDDRIISSCTSLTKVTLPEDMNRIPDGFARGCRVLRQIDLPDTITSIGGSAFSITPITYLVVPSNCTELKTRCFYNMTDLAILDLRATSFESVKTGWSGWFVPNTTVVLLSGVPDAEFAFEEVKIKPGQRIALSHKIPTDKELIWVSTDNRIATVQDGEVSGVLNGTAIIGVSASDGSYSGQCKVIVDSSWNPLVNLAGVAPTTEANNDGKIVGVTDEMEFKLSTDTEWTAVESIEITGLAAGTYEVRCAGSVKEVVVPEFEAVKYDVTFTVTPEGAAVVVKDDEAQVVTPEADGTYKLPEGEYSYEVSAEGYYTQTERFTIGQEAKALTVNLTEKSELQKNVEAAIDGAVGQATQSSNSMDWVAVGLARTENGNLIPEDYLNSLVPKIKALEDKAAAGRYVKPTEYERMTLGICAAGGDPTDVGGYNLIEKIYNGDLAGQGNNAIVFGLIALDSKNYQIPEDAKWNREKLIQAILDAECSNEGTEYGKKAGWTFYGNKADVDMTGMAMTALAPYNNDSHPEIKAAIERAIEWLKYSQNDNGSFSSWGNETSESCAQAIMGLCTNNIDPAGEDFTKNGKTVIDGLLVFEVADHGGFAHILDPEEGIMKFNGMANEQALYALAQYQYYLAGNGSIYSWVDQVEDTEEPVITTDLSDKTVSEATLNFTASANDSIDGKINPVVRFNAQEIQGVDGDYALTLAEGENTIEIVATDEAENTTTQTYKVIYKKSGDETIVGLKDIQLDGRSLVGFDTNLHTYNIFLGLTVNVVPEVTAEAMNPNAKLEITQAEDMNATAIIKLTEADKETVEIYEINFVQMSPDKPTEIKFTEDDDDLDLTELTKEGIEKIEFKIEVEDAKDAKIKFAVKEEDNKKEAVLPKVTVSAEAADVAITAGTKVTSEEKWDGTLMMPTELAKESVANIVNGTTETVIEVGSKEVSLKFDQPVRLVLPGQAGKKAGFVRDGKIVEIIKTLSEDSLEAATEIAAEGDAKIDAGDDLVIWTKHFTQFVAYTEVKKPPHHGGGGGSGGPSGGSTQTVEKETPKVAEQPKVEEVVGSDLTDIKGHWAEKDIQVLVEKGFISGYADKTFKPQANITRAEFASIITRMFNYQPIENKNIQFNDVVASEWYEECVAIAVENDLMHGKGEGVFDPNGKITRQEIAAVIANVLKQRGYVQADSNLIFNDKADIDGWAKDSVALAYENGIVAGTQDGNFNPKSKASRAEAACMLYRLYKLQ